MESTMTDCISKLHIIMGRNAGNFERQAALELQRYIYLITGNLPKIATGSACTGKGCIFIGDWRSNPYLTNAEAVEILKAYAEKIDTEGFVILPQDKDLIILGGSPIACLYGVYELLEYYGAGFHFGGDSIPGKKELSMPAETICKKPVFNIRGSLPWYNFFNSPTTWNLRDYQFFFDQMVKMKNNFVGFHVYNNEPFTAYLDNDTYCMGEPLLTTGESTWGTLPTKTSEFGFGTDSLYDREYFGADAALSGKSRDERIKEQQELLKTALAYAKKRGLKVCLGFEIWGDLTLEEEQEKFRKRLVNLVNTYPMIGYIWLWQPECWCGTEIQERHYHGAGFPLQPERSSFGTAYRKYSGSFSYLSDPRQVNEGVRITMYGNYAYDILKSVSAETKLVLSGWGGDKWLRFSDLYEGLNRTLPKDIVFSALDNINPTLEQNVSIHYGRVPGRETWPIPWFEYDGDQWCSQPFTRQFSYLLKDALDKGCSGILGIHWRTRGVEEVASYTAQFAWNDSLTPEEFYARYSSELYGEKFGPEMSGIHIKLHDLGYRWVGGPGQDECAPFRWRKSPEAEKIHMLKELEQQVKKLLEQAMEQKEWTACDNLSYLYDNMQWVLGFEKAAETFNEDGTPGEGVKLLLEAEAAVSAGRDTEAKELIAAAYRVFTRSGLKEAMQAYSRTVSNRGDMGVLAAINCKAYADYKGKMEKLKQLAEKAGVDFDRLAKEDESALEDKVILLSPVRNTFLDGSLTLDIILQGVKANSSTAKVRLYYRKAGVTCFESLEAAKVTPYIFRVSPRVLKADDLIEYYFEASEGDRCLGRWPSGAPGRLSSIRNVTDGQEAKAEVRPYQAVKLSWQKLDGVSSYNVYRQVKGQGTFAKIAACAENCFEDYSITENTTYLYQIAPTDLKGSAVDTEKWILEVDTREFAAPAAPEIKMNTPGKGKVYLYWEGDGLGVREYRIYRSEGSGREFVLCGTVPVLPDGYQSFSWVDMPGADLCTYKVTSVGCNGKESEASNAIKVIVEHNEIQPVLSLSMDDSIDNPQGYEGKWLTFPLFEKGRTGMAARFLGNNMVYFENREVFSPRFEITILCRIKPEKAEGTIAASGMPGFRGYTMYFKEQKLCFYLAGVGEVEAKLGDITEWNHIAACYDGHQIRIYSNGRLLADRAAMGSLTGFSGQLRIGLGFTGLMKDLSIWPTGLAENVILDFMNK